MGKKDQPAGQLTTNEVPPGAKQITRTTTERFSTPVDEQKVPAADGGDNSGGQEDFADEEVFVGEPELTPVERLLSSLNGDSGEASIYVIRKPDPIGKTFLEPCSMQETAGEIPYDESYTSKEAIEVAVQSIFGGGKYQFQIKIGGKYKASWTNVVADPRRREQPPANQPPQQYIPVQRDEEPRRSVREELQEVITIARDIAAIRNPGGAQPPLPPQPPPDPMETVQKTVSAFKTIQELLGPPAPVGGERNMVDSIAGLVTSLGIGDLIREGGRLVIPHLPGIITALKAGTNGNNAGGGPPSPGTGAANPPSGPNAQPPILPSPTAQPAASPASPATAQNEGGISPEEMQALQEVVDQMRLFNADDDTDDDDADNARRAVFIAGAVGALQRVDETQVQQLIVAPSALLVGMLCQINPQWSDVANDADSISFINHVKEELAKLKVAGNGKPADEGLGEFVNFPRAAEKVNVGQTTSVGKGASSETQSTTAKP